MQRVGIITSGGDAPGTNACIRTVARRCFADGTELMGIYDSWDGLLAGSVKPVSREDVTGIVQTAGTFLRSRRSSLFLNEGDEQLVINALESQKIEGLIVIGGNGSQMASEKLSASGFPVVGIPKTIDNDLVGTDLTVGYQTAVEMCTRALDSLRATAESHNRVMVVEVMGRDSGWIAVDSSIAGGADLALIPEFDFTLEDVCDSLKTRHEKYARNYSIIVIAEGAIDSGGVLAMKNPPTDALARPKLGGVGQLLARQIESRTGYNARCTTLGYLQRCAVPVAADRILATRLSNSAYDMLQNGKFGIMIGLKGAEIKDIPLSQVAGCVKKVSKQHLEIARLFG